jgi:acyl-CoA thioesterase-1
MDRRYLLLASLFAAGCARETPQPAAAVEAEAKPAAAAAPADARAVIAAFGDSLTAGYGVEPGLGFPELLQKELDRQGYAYRVVNLGISGDTSNGGVARIDTATSLKPAVVILELGANDGLRGLRLASTRANLEEMIRAFQGSGAKVLLAGITLPRNYGPDYIRGFEAIYRDLAKQYQTAFLPFLLEGVAADPKLMQGDRLHPTAEGNRKVSAHVLRALRPLLGKPTADRK